jgi:hypothetical protein
MWLLLIGPTARRVDEGEQSRAEDPGRAAPVPADESEPVAVRG